MFRQRDPRWVELADKVLVKPWVRRNLGDQWVTPNLYSGTELPPREDRNWPLPFVLKANNGWRRNFFARSLADVDWPRIEALCDSWMKMKLPYGIFQGEWHYAEIPARLLCEPLLEIEQGVDDIRLWCFGGRVEFVQMSHQRAGVWHNRFYDRDWVPQSFSYVRALDPVIVDAPNAIEEMVAGAERLAEGFRFVRVDLYRYLGRPRFGEMTFTPTAGLGRFYPREADDRLGELWSDAMRPSS